MELKWPKVSSAAPGPWSSGKKSEALASQPESLPSWMAIWTNIVTMDLAMEKELVLESGLTLLS